MSNHYFKKQKKFGCSLDLIFDPRGVIDTAQNEFADLGSKNLYKFEAIFETA
jgi:hypothetical protein